VLFLNNDIEALAAGWLQRLRSLAARPDVGAVGPLLLYDDRTVQHAGVILGFNNGAEHAMKFQPAMFGEARNPGYNGMLTAVRDFSAVTAACMMLRKDVFDSVGGFDEAFAIGFNDTDLCLRLRERGLKVLYDGHTMLLHRESATRAETKQVLHPEDAERLQTRWARYFTEGDPFYNPLLAVEANDHALREDAGCKRRPAARVMDVALAAPADAAASPPARKRPARRR
jgi:GT2 family glycosyltransferase